MEALKLLCVDIRGVTWPKNDYELLPAENRQVDSLQSVWRGLHIEFQPKYNKVSYSVSYTLLKK